jgi:hypothetical protein
MPAVSLKVHLVPCNTKQPHEGSFFIKPKKHLPSKTSGKLSSKSTPRLAPASPTEVQIRPGEFHLLLLHWQIGLSLDGGRKMTFTIDDPTYRTGERIYQFYVQNCFNMAGKMAELFKERMMAERAVVYADVCIFFVSDGVVDGLINLMALTQRSIRWEEEHYLSKEGREYRKQSIV